jgi:Carboxypeptidase regulatory-like domain
MAKIWLSLLALVVAGNAMAQRLPQTVAVTGTVLDPSGASAPDAVVTLKQGTTSIGAQSQTDASGKFRFAAVPPGNYSIEVQLEGFKKSITPLKVSSQAPAPLKIVLALEGISSQVSVSGEESVHVSTEASENRDSATADQNLLENVPVFDQDYIATMSQFLDSAALGTGGPQVMVNGVEVSSVIVSPSTIQEVRINQNPYSAEISRPGRGTIEIITKGPTPEYHGTFNFLFRDSVLNARDPFSLVRAPEQRRIFEGAFSGPVGHSKTTSFLISGHRQEEDLQSTVFAQGLTGAIQDSVPSPKRDTQLSFRIDHQFSPSHNIFWQYNEWDYPASNQGVGGVVLPEAATDSNQWERELIFNDRWTPSPHWLSQFQILIGKEYHAATSVNTGQQIVVQDAFTSGGAQINHFETENHIQMNEIVSWSGGKHFVKFGMNMPDWSRRGIENRDDFGGTYYFSSLANYAAQLPYAFTQQQGSGKVVYWQKELGGFVQDDYRVRPNLTVSLGLRYNWQNYLYDNKQFAPRFAFAYSPVKSGKLVFRGGAGIFFDRTGPRPIGDVLLYNGQLLKSYLLINPSYPNPFASGGSLASQPSNIDQFDPAIREPYTIQYSFGAEWQIKKQTTVAATYSGSRGIDLFRSQDINAPLPPDYLTVPNPSLGFVRQIESAGRQAGDSLDITVRGALTHRLSGLIQYTLSRTENNTGGIGWYPANQYDLTGEWARADFDQRQRLNLLESFNAGRSFTIGVGLSLATGKPYTLTTGQDAYHTGLANERPDSVPRNTLQGPGYVDFDLRLSRDFYLSKDKKEKGKVLTIGFDAFDVINRVNYTSFVGNMSSPFFGEAVSAFPTRRLQLTTRFKF